MLGAAIRKYGSGAFDHQVLEIVSTKEEADSAETGWVEHFECRAPRGYNIAAGGSGPGYHHEDTKRRIGAASHARLQTMTPSARSEHVRKSWSPARKIREAEAGVPQETRAKISRTLSDQWARLSPEEKNARIQRQRAGVSFAQNSARMRKVWATVTPEARVERVRKAREGAIKAGPLRSKKMSEWQTARQKTLTPEQRSAVVLKAWETRRRNNAQRVEAVV